MVHSHYENLKVARNAPIEVIRAAYRTLSQKYHPDKNPGDREAARIMTAINAAYETLSDPLKRQEHDRWIAQAEADQAGAQSTRGRPFTINDPPRQASPQPPRSLASRLRQTLGYIVRYWYLCAIAAFFLIGVLTDKPTAPPPGPKPYVGSPPSSSSTPALPASRPKPLAYERPLSAPNGELWPISAAYVRGYPRIHNRGLSQVTIDNSQNDSDVFVKLVSLDSAEAFPVRVFYIPASQSFTVHKVTAGTYDIRFRNLTTGRLSRTPSFTLDEFPTQKGTRYSTITMTLYKVPHGNMQTYDLSESEF